MAEPFPYVITISRQLGSGGAFLGRQLANELEIRYADRDILERAAQSLHYQPEELEPRDESAPSFLDSALEAISLGVLDTSYVLTPPLPSHLALRDAESTVIREIGARYSAVIVGRGGYHVLASHERHLSVFLYADLEFRMRRVKDLFGYSDERALAVIEESDRNRARCLRELTGRSWNDASQYHVSLCTSSLGLMLSARVLVDIAKHRFRADAGRNH